MMWQLQAACQVGFVSMMWQLQAACQVGFVSMMWQPVDQLLHDAAGGLGNPALLMYDTEILNPAALLAGHIFCTTASCRVTLSTML
jgi:hypothetical protein